MNLVDASKDLERINPSNKSRFRRLVTSCSTLLIAVTLASCSQSTDFSDLEVERNGSVRNGPDIGSRGLVVDPDTQEPFTGFAHGTSPKWEGQIKDGLFDGPLVSYNEDGELFRKGVYSKGRQDGLWETYWSDEQLMSKFSYVEGVDEGPAESYYTNGQLRWVGSYSNGEREGSLKSYFENGNLEESSVYSNGNMHGPYELYHPNGQVKTKGTKDHGLLHGPFFEFSDGGTIVAKGMYFEHRRCGEWQIEVETSRRGGLTTYEMQTKSYPACPENMEEGDNEDAQ